MLNIAKMTSKFRNCFEQNFSDTFKMFFFFIQTFFYVLDEFQMMSKRLSTKLTIIRLGHMMTFFILGNFLRQNIYKCRFFLGQCC